MIASSNKLLARLNHKNHNKIKLNLKPPRGKMCLNKSHPFPDFSSNFRTYHFLSFCDIINCFLHHLARDLCTSKNNYTGMTSVSKLSYG